jgi:CRP-like cAMP-binding protein
MAKRLQKAHEIIRQLSALPVDQRVASTLVRLADKFGQPDEVGFLIQLPLSRQDLAQMTGSTPETVSRVLSEFKREGLIRTGREWVALLDQDALTRLFT